MLRQTPVEEVKAAREREKREAVRYRNALAAAPVYRSEIRSLLIQYPERYRASGRIGLGELWHGADRSQAFRCTHPEKSISRAEQDGWQLVLCDRRSAYFLRGPVETAMSDSDKNTAPIVEEVFEILRISYYDQARSVDREGSPPAMAPAIDDALPAIYDPPTKADLAQVGITPGEGGDVRVAYHDYKRRKEISVYDEAGQTVVTVIFNVKDETASIGVRATKIGEKAVIWVSSPRADLSVISELLSRGQEYVGGISNSGD